MLNSAAWKYYWKLYNGTYRQLLFCVLMTVAQILPIIALALLLRKLFDTVIPAKNFKYISLICIAMIALSLINMGITLLTQKKTISIVKYAIQRLREDLLYRFYLFSQRFYSDTDLNRLHACMTLDSERIDLMSQSLIIRLIPSLIVSVALSILMLYMNWLLFLCLISATPLLLIFAAVAKNRLKMQTIKYHQAFEQFSKGILFILQMMELTRIQSAQTFEVQRQTDNLVNVGSFSAAATWYSSLYQQLNNFIIALSSIIVLFVGGTLVIDSKMSMGTLLTFFVLAAMQKRYLSNLNAAIPELIRGRVALNNFYNTIQIEDREPYQGQLKLQPNSISLKNVSFTYQQETVLHEINLCINTNSSIAIIGPNGSGKSTIAKLMLGFYRPQTGALYADGIPYEQLDMQYLRKSIGVITQSPELFSGSILDNITYGNPNADFNTVLQAATLATADQFIQTFSDGYNTFVGENGTQLSGGQRQRIAIARALLHQPTLLILDEPSNHLDNKAITQLIQNLKSLPNKPALLIISHDMVLINTCDYVYHLQAGRLTLSQQQDIITAQAAIKSQQ